MPENAMSTEGLSGKSSIFEVKQARNMKENSKWIGRAVLVLVAAALIGGCIYLNSLMCIITGYAAKNLASAVFVSGRDQADVEALDLNFSFIKFNRNKVDYKNGTVTSRFIWGKSTAVYREGYGVTLLRGKKAAELRAETFPLEPETASDTLWRDNPDGLRLNGIAKSLIDDKAYGGNPFAFVVLHHGLPVAEYYAEGFGPETKLLSWSMGKSFTQALAGIMSGDGMVDIYAPTGIPEWQGDGRAAITLNNLMQMQSGLQWNEDYGNRSDVNLMLHRERDMGLYAQSKPLEYEPGTHWYYSSGSTNIVMRCLRGKFASDAEFLGYMRERLFAPLGIRNAVFEVDMSGIPVGSSYLYVTPRDFARFGQMYLDGGVFAGKRILPEGWTEYTATPASASEGGYGSFFWLNRNKSLPDAPADTYSCQGHDGQEIYIIPSEDMVVVELGYSPRPNHTVDFNRLLKDVIAAAE